MIRCAIYGCTNNTAITADPTIQYYCFPKHPEVAKQWIAACSFQENKIDINTGEAHEMRFKNTKFCCF